MNHIANEKPSTNEVTLSGCIAAPVVTATDETRFIVEIRDDAGHKSSVDCTSASPRVRQTLARLGVGSRVHLSGRLRRRFWRSAQGVASRLVVDVNTLRRLRP